jgi:hypothetical protein
MQRRSIGQAERRKKKREFRDIDKQFDEKKTKTESYSLFNQPDYQIMNQRHLYTQPYA